MFRIAQTIDYPHYVIYFHLKCRILAEKFARKFVVFEKNFPLFMTSSWRHKTKFWGWFLHFLKVQTNIYQMMACNKHHLKRSSSYIQLKRSRFAVFWSCRRESRESGTVTFHVSLFKCPGWKFVGKVWNFCVLLLDDVTSWWMFKWRSGALARAQIRLCLVFVRISHFPHAWHILTVLQ